jgi:hypothetical protein
MVLRRIFPTAVCEKVFGEELGPGNEPCEGWNQPVLLRTPSLGPPVGNKCNCHEWDELVPEFIADFARVHRPDGSRMALAQAAKRTVAKILFVGKDLVSFYCWNRRFRA